MFQVKRCRLCDGPLDSILHLGDLQVSGFPSDAATLAPPTAPLDFSVCRDCALVQLRHTVEPDRLFRDQYWYRSSVNETMRAELADVVEQATARVPLSFHDPVVDVGANDGTLLANYRDYKALCVAFEPATNLHAELGRHCDVLIPNYFPDGCASWGEEYENRVKILTSIACFYDLDDPRAFVEAVARWLHPRGVWIVQFQDLHQMLQATAFDNIVHEHLFYPSLGAIERLIAPHGLRVVDCETRAINGGSLRLTIQHDTPAARAHHRVDEQRIREAGCDGWQALERFAWRAGEIRKQLQTVIQELLPFGPIDLYGASTKFNTLAQWCQLDGAIIRQAWERSPEKWGRYTITGIPIVPEEAGRARPPATLLVGIWQFAEHVMQREQDYLATGGRIVVPLPSVNIAWVGVWGGRG